MSKTNKISLAIWLALVATLLISAILTWHDGPHLSANLISLLPTEQQSPVKLLATEQVSRSQGQKIALLISHADQQQLLNLLPELDRQLQGSGIISTDDIVSQQQVLVKMYAPYQYQLMTKSQQNQITTDPNTLLQTAMANLYNPFSGISAQEYLADPALTLRGYLNSQADGMNKLQLVNGRLWAKTEQQKWLLMPLTLIGEAYSFDTQDKLLSLISSIEERWPELKLYYTGAPFYAAYGANSARNEISTIGVGSLIGIVLLILVVFRSLTPLVFASVSILLGVVAAALVTQWLFGFIHLFSLVFGACLIGVSIDYAFHYFVQQYQGLANWSARQAIKEIFPGITLGLLTSIIGYLALGLTPFPGLQQVALFSVVGLIVAYLSVVLAFPVFLHKSKAKSKGLVWSSPALITFWSRWPLHARLKLVALLTLLITPCLLFLHSDDDIRQLQSLSPKLKQMEQNFKQIAGVNFAQRYFVVEANTVEQLLLTEKQLIAQLKIQMPEAIIQSIAKLLPPEAEQKANFDAYQQHILPLYRQTLHQAGFDKHSIRQQQMKIQKMQFSPLTLQHWLKDDASIPWRFLWLNTQATPASIMLIQSQNSSAEIKAAILNLAQVQLVDKADEFSALFSQYRQKMALLLFLAYVVILCLLLLRYPWQSAFAIVAVPGIAVLVTLAVLALSGVGINLFHLLALVLVSGIGIDYSLFFAESTQHPERTLLAIALSSATTLLSFGLLALSATPAVQAVGVSVCLGISIAYLLGPLPFITKEEQ